MCSSDLIQTQRLRLRPLSVDDAEGYGRLLADPGVHPFVVEAGPVPMEAIPARIETRDRKSVV